jgi:VCBS repeat-containing protein
MQLKKITIMKNFTLKTFVLLLFIVLSLTIHATTAPTITLNPTSVVLDQSNTWTFDFTGSSLTGSETLEIYFWQPTIHANIALTNLGGKKWSLTFTPTTFFGLTMQEISENTNQFYYNIQLAGVNYSGTLHTTFATPITTIAPISTISNPLGTYALDQQVTWTFDLTGSGFKAGNDLYMYAWSPSMPDPNFNSSTAISKLTYVSGMTWSKTITPTTYFGKTVAEIQASAGFWMKIKDQTGKIETAVFTVPQTIKGNSSITATGTASYTYSGSAQGPASSTVTGSSGAITYSYSGTGSTVYSATTTKPTNVGTYQVIASVAADASYNAASSSALAFSIAIAPQTITFGTLSTKNDIDANFDLTATASSGLAITYASSNTAVASVTGSTVTIISEGTTTITASQAGNSNIAAATSVPQTLTVTTPSSFNLKKTFLFDFGNTYASTSAPDANGNYWNNINTLNSNDNFALVDKTNLSAYNLQLLSTFGQSGGVNNGLASPESAQLGELAIATATGDYFYTNTNANFKLTGLSTSKRYKFYIFGSRVDAASRQTKFSITGLNSTPIEGILTTSGTSIGLVGGLVYNGNTSNILVSTKIKASVSGEIIINVLKLAGANAHINAMKVEEYYNDQTITFGSLPTGKTVGEDDFNPGATSATSAINAITYSSSNTEAATIVSNKIHIVGVGTTIITASQGAGSNYNAATNVTQSITIAARPIIPISSYATSANLTTPTADINISGAATTLLVDATKTVNNVSVGSDTKLNLSDGKTLILTGNLDLKADLNTSFSTNIGNGGISISGNVRYLKTIDDQKWYFVAFPCEVPIFQITTTSGSLGILGNDWFIKYYDGEQRALNGASTTNWKSITNTALSLEANRGYIIGLAGNSNTTKELSFPIDKNLFVNEIAKTIPVLANNGGTITNNGWNLVGQPYLSKYDVQGAGFSSVYFSKSNGIGYENYIKEFDGTRLINPFSAYFVQVGGNGNISFDKVFRQSSPTSVSTSISDKLQINFSTPAGTDRTNIIMDNDQATNYVIGEDLEKWLGAEVSVYTVLDGINYALNSLPIATVNNLALAYYTQTSGSATISVNATRAPSLSKLILLDKTFGIETDLLTSDYTFDAIAGTNNSRFVISAQRISTANDNKTDAKTPILAIINSKLRINNLNNGSIVRVYDALGRMVANKVGNNSTLEVELSTNGIYTVQMENGEKSWVKKIANK